MSHDRVLPSFIDGYGPVRPYPSSEPLAVAKLTSVKMHAVRTGNSKCLPSIDAALEACEIRDGATLSFHHHLRNGDHVLNTVLEACAARGLKAALAVGGACVLMAAIAQTVRPEFDADRHFLHRVSLAGPPSAWYSPTATSATWRCAPSSLARCSFA